MVDGYCEGENGNGDDVSEIVMLIMMIDDNGDDVNDVMVIVERFLT